MAFTKSRVFAMTDIGISTPVELAYDTMLLRMVGYSPHLQIPKQLYIVKSPKMMTLCLPTVNGAVTVVEEVAM